MTYICANMAVVLDKDTMDMESCLDVSMQHDNAPKGPCKHLIVIEFGAIPVEEQCKDMHYNEGDNVRCIRRRIHDGKHVARKGEGFILWG